MKTNAPLSGFARLTIVGLVATRIPWIPALGAAFAAILLIGAATFGSASVSFRLTHPGLVIGFAEDSLQLIGEVVAIVAGIVATVQFFRNQAAGHRLTG